MRVIQKGDVIGCDSDLIGPYGYAHDISRTWMADGTPDDRQRRLYAAAYEHVHRNMELLKPGLSFLELQEKGFTYPPELAAQNLTTIFHGIGLENEWPIIMSPDKAHIPGAYGGGYDGVVEIGMTLCIESYAGQVGGPDGIKLEEQVLVTETGNRQAAGERRSPGRGQVGGLGRTWRICLTGCMSVSLTIWVGLCSLPQTMHSRWRIGGGSSLSTTACRRRRFIIGVAFMRCMGRATPSMMPLWRHSSRKYGGQRNS